MCDPMSITRDDDEHVFTRDRFESLLAVHLTQRFMDDARARCNRAEAALVAAHAEAERALDYLNRTIQTTEQALRLHTMNRR